MSSALNYIKKKTDDTDFIELNINSSDSKFQKNSVLLKDMIFTSKVDKATQNIIGTQKKNIIIQKWYLNESQRNGLHQQKTHEHKEESFSPQKQRRLSQTTSNCKNQDSKGASPKKINEVLLNDIQQDLKKQNNIHDTNRIHSQRNESSRQASSPQELVKTIELQLDTNDRYTENLNKINFFTERTSSLIEMNNRKKNKEQKSYQKSPQNESQNKMNENENINYHSQTNQQNKQKDMPNNIIVRTNFSNLLTNQGHDGQHINEANSQSILKHIFVIDGYNKKRDRSSVLNKSDNEIRFGQLEDQEKKEQNMSQSDIYRYSGEKHIQPKRKLLEFPQQESAQLNIQHQNRHHIKKPFISGAQSHFNQGSNQLPNIKQNLKKSSQSPFKYVKQDLNISENQNNKTQQTLISDYLNRTIYSPLQKNDIYTIQVSDQQMSNSQYKQSTKINNNVTNQNRILYENKAITQTQQTQVSENQNKFSEKNNNRNYTQIDFFQVHELSPLVMKKNQVKCSSMNQQRNSDFIQINKKNLKFISNKKKNTYNQIVDSIIKQHDIKEKDEKKAASKDKRIKLQQMFKQTSIQSKQMQSAQNQNSSNLNHNLTTTIVSDFHQYANSNSTSPVMRANTSLTNRNNQVRESDFFLPQGKALRNMQYNEQIQKMNQQNIEAKMQQNSQTVMNFFPSNEKIPQFNENQNSESKQFAISYQIQQQIQFKRKMKSRQNRKQNQITVEEQMNNEQIKQKLINLQQQKTQIYNNLNLSPHNKVSNTLINDSKILNNSQIMQNIGADQLQMTQNLQKQASQIKRQQQQILNVEQSQLVQNALNSAGQNMLLIKKWNVENSRQNNFDYSDKQYLKKATTAIGPRKKENKQSESDVMLVDENIFSVNHRPKYYHDKPELTNNNFNSSKKKIKSQNMIKVNESNDFANTIKNKNQDFSYKNDKNEILPWEINEQQLYYDESEDICNHTKV